MYSKREKGRRKKAINPTKREAWVCSSILLDDNYRNSIAM
jgi:hypothetical protein